jgi:acetyltransferase-like isoleucine patch superfamily enzyme
MIKNNIKKLVRIVFYCIYRLYNYNSMMYFKNIKDIIYSYWIRNSFKSCGTEFHVYSPASIKGNQYISIGKKFNTLDGLRLECWDSFGNDVFKPKLIIGNNVIMNRNVHIGCIEKVVIGDNVLFASNIFISDHQHGYIDKRDLGIIPGSRSLITRGPVIIENNVWIGENVAIMPNVTIGKGCIIGANSVVTKSFPKNSVLAGVPAKLIKSLESE